MSSPLKRPIAIVGLLLLGQIAWLLVQQTVSPAQAGLRALVVLILVRVTDRVADRGLRKVARAAALASTRGIVVPAADTADAAEES